MLGEEEGVSIMTVGIDRPLEEIDVGPTSIDVTDDRVSIGPTSIDVTDEQASILETPPAEQQEEKVQEQNKQIEQAQEEFKISNRKQKRRITSYLSNIAKQVDKQGNQINKLNLLIQSLQKQTKPTVNVAMDQSQLQSIKQIKSQVIQLQKQVTRLQDGVRRIKTASVIGARQGTKTKVRKRVSSSSVKPRSKKTKLYRGIQSRRQKSTARNRLKKPKS
jgi:hypothetical protein